MVGQKKQGGSRLQIWELKLLSSRDVWMISEGRPVLVKFRTQSMEWEYLDGLCPKDNGFADPPQNSQRRKSSLPIPSKRRRLPLCWKMLRRPVHSKKKEMLSSGIALSSFLGYSAEDLRGLIRKRLYKEVARVSLHVSTRTGEKFWSWILRVHHQRGQNINKNSLIQEHFFETQDLKPTITQSMRKIHC